MKKISLIAAVDSEMGIGKNNALLCHLPRDLAYFKQMTLGKPILMGKNTWLSLKIKPLPHRQNIVLSTSLKAEEAEGALIARNLDEVFSITAAYSELMVIGGAAIYQLLLPRADTLYLTHIEHCFHADVFFPALNLDEWKSVKRETYPADEKNPYLLHFCEYIRR